MNNIGNIDNDNNIITFETVKEKLENLMEKHNSIVEIGKRLKTIKNEYEPIKKNYIQVKKQEQYKNPVKNVNYKILYPDIFLTQNGELKITTRSRVLLFTDWYNNHFKLDSPDADNEPILKNSDLVSLQSKIFFRLYEEAKNKEPEDMLVSKSDLRREGQRLFKCIIDDGEGRWGNIQVKYCMMSLALKARDVKIAREVHREEFSRILFAAFAEGDFFSRQKK